MSLAKKVIIMAAVIFGLIIFGSIAPFIPQFLSFLPFYTLNTPSDRALEQKLKGKFGAAKPPPVVEITYSNVPESVKRITMDCKKLEVLPKRFRGLRYYCQNIYLTDAEQLKTQTNALKPERILLYGQYSYYDCPVTSPTVSDMIGGCLSAAKFLDNWQIPRMISVLGVQPTKKVYYHFTQTYKESEEICQSLGAKKADACATPDGQIYLVAGTVSSKQFTSAGESRQAAVVEGVVQPIVYNFTTTYPQNCFSRDTHEILHFFDFQSYGAVAPEWFEEGFVRLLIRPLYNLSCPPGLAVSDVTKKEGNVVIALSDFDLGSLDLEEPLSAGLTNYANGNQCRKALYMQMARNIKNGGAVYIKQLYSALQKTPPTKEAAVAQAIWESSNKDTGVKKFLSQNGCALRAF